MTKPVLLIIPCLNEENYIRSLVEKLIADNENLPNKIIIADGGSDDKTPIIAKELEKAHDNVHYLHNPARIQSAAINLAVKEHGKGADYLIRIDAHADYSGEFCQTLLEEAKDKEADSVVVSMNTVGNKGFQIAVAAAQN